MSTTGFAWLLLLLIARSDKIEPAKTRQDFVADSLCSKLVSASKIPSSFRWRSSSKAASARHFGHRLSAPPANRKEAEKKERKRPPGGRARHTAGRFRSFFSASFRFAG